jgi:hypothetical protein
MLAAYHGASHTYYMDHLNWQERQAEAPWGQPAFDRDRFWYQRYASELDGNSNQYREIRQKALEDPHFDLFSNFMPTGRPKHDIGRYALRHGIRVPLIRSQVEWEEAFRNGTAMLRSEMHQDYEGYSGLLETVQIRQHLDSVYGYRRLFQESFSTDKLGDSLTRVYRKGLRDGTINPTAFMRTFVWPGLSSLGMSRADISRLINETSIEWSMDSAEVSRWRYVPGINIKVMRDPVIEGKYYIGGHNKYDDWVVDATKPFEELIADNDFGEETYRLPAKKIVSLYERVRTLPYFDSRQAPVMEMQYGDDGKLYFLQYLKTNRLIGDPGEFAFPTTDGAAIIHGQVIGATDPRGEKMRLYLEPAVLTPKMKEQAIMIDWGEQGFGVQVMSRAARVVFADLLHFNHGHFDSAPFMRAPIAASLDHRHSEVDAEVRKRLRELAPDFRAADRLTTATYLDTVITSNGRQIAIQSDWQPKKEEVN